MLMSLMLIFSVNAEEEACDHPYGSTIRVRNHVKSGGGCYCEEESYCSRCGV